MATKRPLFRIQYRTRFIVSEPTETSQIVDLQIVESSWRNQLHEVQRLLDRASRPWLNVQTRMKFIGRGSQIIDEFYMSEMPTLFSDAVASEPLTARLTQRITTASVELMERASALLVDDLLPKLTAAGLPILRVDTLSCAQRAWLRDTFQQQIFPLLIPQAVDASRPFPHIDDPGLNLLVELAPPRLAGVDTLLFASITLPSNAPRLIAIPAMESTAPTYVWYEDVVRHFVDLLFPGVEVLNAHPFRVLRAREPVNDADAAPSTYRPVTRLDIEHEMPASLLKWLTRHLHESKTLVVRGRPPLGLADMAPVVSQFPRRSNWLMHHLDQMWRLFFGHIE